MSGRNLRTLLIGVVISLLAFYFALRNVNLSSLKDAIFAASPAWMIAVLTSYMVHFWLKAMRWCDLLEPVYKARTVEAYPVMMTGFFANNLLPAHLGEFVRMYVGSKFFGVRKTEVLATIVLERILDFSVIVVMFGGALIAGGAISAQLVNAGYLLLAGALVMWLVIAVSLRFEQPTLRVIAWFLKPFPERLAERLLEMLSRALSALHSMKSVRLVLRSVVLSFLQWALVGLAVFAALRSVGVEISMAAAVVTLAATVLAVALPAAPGFFGTIQLAFVLALAPYAVSESDALAGSIIFHLVSYLFVMLSGVFALRQLSMKFGDLKQGADAGQDRAE